MPTIDVPNGHLHYLDKGSGQPALVLVHAFPLSAAMWRPQLAALATRHRVIAPDLRGFGKSDAPTERDAYSVEAWADDVAALVAALQVEPVVLGGLSLGGYVAFAFVRRHRTALAGLVLADTRPGSDKPEVLARREKQQHELQCAGEPAELADLLLGALVGATSTRRQAVLALARELMAGARPEGLIGALEAMKKRPSSTPDLASIEVPTLVAVGEQDQPSPPEVAREMADAIPGARLTIIADAGHLSNLENPAAFNQALETFLDGI